MAAGGRLQVVAPDGFPEVSPGDDLPGMVVAALSGVEPAVADGDVVVVTSKVVSKAEGRLADADEHEARLAEETVRTVARPGRTAIVRNRLGLVMAAAGIDRSNVVQGRIVLLPLDPDASAAAVRRRVLADLGANVGVVVTDTAGRAWREGQTDIAIGVAGLLPLESHVGQVDAHGHELAVTAPAVADELAGAVELAQGKLGGRPVALVRGRADLLLAAGDDGPGARALQRHPAGDMFGLGTREAVVAALLGHPDEQHLFGAPVAAEDLTAVLARFGDDVRVRALEDAVGSLPDGTPDGVGLAVSLPPRVARAALEALCFSHGWRLRDWSADAEGALAHISPAVP